MLRPGQPADRLVYPGDDDASTRHLGVRAPCGTLVSVASFYIEPMPGNDAPALRIRGMATDPAHRGLGHGRRLIEAGLTGAGSAGYQHGNATMGARSGQQGAFPTLAWCNARTTAAGYYAKLGFTQHGEMFDLPDIGPHLRMVRRIDRQPLL